MKKITDELLNDYIDNQLDTSSINELKESIGNDPDSLNKLKALKIVDESLHNLEVFEAPHDFPDRMMELVFKHAKFIKPKINLFFAGIVSVFGIVIASVFIAAIILVAKTNPPLNNSGILESTESFIDKNVSFLGGLFNNNQFLFAGGLLAVILLLSTLIIIDTHKNFKNKLKSISN